MKNYVQTGKNITLLASQLIFPTHVAGDTFTNLVGPSQGLAVPINLVESGDQVVCGTLIGVANQDALRSTDSIVVSTEGVFTLSVTGINAGGNVAVAVGDKLFIDPATAAINKKVANIPYGIALAPVISGATTLIPVMLTGF